MMRLSPTSVLKYETCPRCYYYEEILRLRPVHQSAHLVFGQVMHQLIEQGLRALLVQQPLALSAHFDRLWSQALSTTGVEYSATQSPEVLAEIGRRLAEQFSQRWSQWNLVPVCAADGEPMLERKLELALASDLTFVGRVDLLVLDSDLRLTCLDLKTPSQATDPEWWDISDQLTGYQLLLDAHHRLWGGVEVQRLGVVELIKRPPPKRTGKGPMGTGKSSLIAQTAARLNLNVIQVNVQRRLELADLIGHLTVIGGDMLFQDGPLTTALRRGWWLLINEADLMDPGELAGLNTVLDGGPLVIAENASEVVHPTLGWGLICTANTVGLGDRDGLYAGTRRMNAAFLDRFWVVDVDYPERAEELYVLRRAAPQLPDQVIEGMVDVAEAVRRLFKADEGAIETPFSTRTLIRWAYLVQQYRGAPQPLSYALKRALTQRTEPETAEAIHGIVQRIMGEGGA